MHEQEDRTFHDIPSPLLWVVFIVASIGTVMLALYLYQFRGALSKNQEVWGAFGDFMGGILNPLFALAALIALLVAISIQRTELQATKAALDRSTDVMREQHKVLEIQTFEATFFKLLGHLETLRQAVVGKIRVARSSGSATLATPRETMEVMHQTLISCFPRPQENISNEATLQQIVDVLAAYSPELKAWTQTFVDGVTLIVRFIDASSIDSSRKSMYQYFLRYQTSPFEQALIYYYLIGNAYRAPELLLMANQAGIFSDMRKEFMASESHLSILEMVVEGKLRPVPPTPKEELQDAQT